MKLGLALLALALGTAPLLAATRAFMTLPSEDTQLFVNGQLTSQRGYQRTFVYETSQLDAQTKYHYDFRAVIEIDGVVHDQSVGVDFLPGNDLKVDFVLHQYENSRALWFRGTAEALPGEASPPSKVPVDADVPSAPVVPGETPVVPPSNGETPVVPPTTLPQTKPAPQPNQPSVLPAAMPVRPGSGYSYPYYNYYSPENYGGYPYYGGYYYGRGCGGCR